MQAALKAFKVNKVPLTRQLITERQKATQAIKPEWEKFTSPTMFSLLSEYSIAIGSATEYIFFPLLTASAAMLGAETNVQLGQMWTEPAILWTIVASRKGEKKSAAMRLIANAVRAAEVDMQKDFREQHLAVEQEGDKETNEGELPVICMTNSQFTFTKLHEQMSQNNGECLLLYDEIAALYDQLEQKSGGSHCDRKILLSLYGGDPWTRATKSNGSCSMDMTNFNYTGFMQPTIAIAMLSQDDFDGFNDRHVAIVCPERKKVYFEDLTPLPETTISLGTLLIMMRRFHHTGKTLYKLSDEASVTFGKYYNYLEDRMEECSQDEDHRGILSKAQGQSARIAMVLHCLHHAVQHQANTPEAQYNPSLTIEKLTVEWAIELMEFCIKQKFAMMPPLESSSKCATVSDTQDEEYNCDQIWEKFPRNIKSLLECGQVEMDASFVAQRRLMPPLGTKTANKYPVAAAKAYLRSLASAGLGEMIGPNTNSKKRSSTLTFRKRNFDDLEEPAKIILQQIHVTEETYKKCKVMNV